jgi:hypothetical protein
LVAVELRPQRLARGKQMLLADEFVEGAGTHAVGEGAGKGVVFGIVGVVRRSGEEAHVEKSEVRRKKSE